MIYNFTNKLEKSASKFYNHKDGKLKNSCDKRTLPVISFENIGCLFILKVTFLWKPEWVIIFLKFLLAQYWLLHVYQKAQ
jgi:hypothetical protein